MREPTALIKEYDEQEELVVENVDSVVDAFKLPVRNWNLIIDVYNAANKKKFPFNALSCRVIIEYVKKGIPPQYIFKTLGVSHQKYTFLISRYTDLETRLVELGSKSERTEEEYEEYQSIMRSPFRLLMSDIDRAEGASELKDLERFNEVAQAGDTAILAMKMKAKFKDMFEGKDSSGSGYNVTINLGNSFIEDL